MNARHTAGGLFILGFDGTEVTDEIEGWIERYRPAGWILFGRNIVSPIQVARLCSELHRLYPDATPPIICVDQEGGRVARLRAPFTEFPSARIIGDHVRRTGSFESLIRAAEVIAIELTAVGINLNLAPVLDVDSNPANPVIGDRSFGREPRRVAAIGRCLIETWQSRGLLACAKHFPGHGDTATDSHHELPIVERPLAELERVEWPPFKEAIAAGVAAIMTAHVRFSALDEAYPATLSHRILTGLLRDEMGFDGLIVTDNMEMKGVWGRYPAAELVRRGVEAGCDLFIGGGGGLDGRFLQSAIQIELIEVLAEQLERGQIDDGAVARSLERINVVRTRELAPYRMPNEKELSDLIGSPAHRAVAAEFSGAEDAMSEHTCY